MRLIRSSVHYLLLPVAMVSSDRPVNRSRNSSDWILAAYGEQDLRLLSQKISNSQYKSAEVTEHKFVETIHLHLLISYSGKL